MIKFWWLPLALISVAATVAAWIFREQALDLRLVSDAVARSTAAVEAKLIKPPARRVEYRARVTTGAEGQGPEATIRHVAEHIGGGWIRRSDDWYEGGSLKPTYQERYLIYRNLLQAYQKRRVTAPSFTICWPSLAGWPMPRRRKRECLRLASYRSHLPAD